MRVIDATGSDWHEPPVLLLLSAQLARDIAQRLEHSPFYDYGTQQLAAALRGDDDKRLPE